MAMRNICGACGYSWNPRGHVRSAHCPNCRSAAVYLAGSPTRSSWGCGVWVAVAFVVFGMLGTCGTCLTCGALSSSRPRHRPAPAPVAEQPEASAAPSDEAARIIGLCGKPSRDFIDTEGGIATRHLFYAVQRVELTFYVEPDGGSRGFVGAFPLPTKPSAAVLSSDETNRRMPCAKGTIRSPI